MSGTDQSLMAEIWFSQGELEELNAELAAGSTPLKGYAESVVSRLRPTPFDLLVDMAFAAEEQRPVRVAGAAGPGGTPNAPGSGSESGPTASRDAGVRVCESGELVASSPPPPMTPSMLRSRPPRRSVSISGEIDVPVDLRATQPQLPAMNLDESPFATVEVSYDEPVRHAPEIAALAAAVALAIEGEGGDERGASADDVLSSSPSPGASSLKVAVSTEVGGSVRNTQASAIEALTRAVQESMAPSRTAPAPEAQKVQEQRQEALAAEEPIAEEDRDEDLEIDGDVADEDEAEAEGDENEARAQGEADPAQADRSTERAEPMAAADAGPVPATLEEDTDELTGAAPAKDELLASARTPVTTLDEVEVDLVGEDEAPPSPRQSIPPPPPRQARLTEKPETKPGPEPDGTEEVLGSSATPIAPRPSFPLAAAAASRPGEGIPQTPITAVTRPLPLVSEEGRAPASPPKGLPPVRRRTPPLGVPLSSWLATATPEAISREATPPREPSVVVEPEPRPPRLEGTDPMFRKPRPPAATRGSGELTDPAPPPPPPGEPQRILRPETTEPIRTGGLMRSRRPLEPGAPVPVPLVPSGPMGRESTPPPIPPRHTPSPVSPSAVTPHEPSSRDTPPLLAIGSEGEFALHEMETPPRGTQAPAHPSAAASPGVPVSPSAPVPPSVPVSPAALALSSVPVPRLVEGTQSSRPRIQPEEISGAIQRAAEGQRPSEGAGPVRRPTPVMAGPGDKSTGSSGTHIPVAAAMPPAPPPGVSNPPRSSTQQSGPAVPRISPTPSIPPPPIPASASIAVPPPPPVATPQVAPPAPVRNPSLQPGPPPAPVSLAAAPPPPPPPGGADELRQRKRRRGKQWFEEIFDEDYLRTLPHLTPRQTEREVAFIQEALELPPNSRVLDVGCGYGRHAMEMASRGHRPVGIDLSLPLLIRAADAARRVGVNVDFVHGDMREMTFENEFDAAYCFFTTFGYFDDDTNRKVAAGICRALKPGGRFVLDLINRDYLIGDLPTRIWWQGDGCVVLEEVDFNYFTSRLQVQRQIILEDGRQLEHEISIRAYSLHEIGKVLHHAGFRVLEVSGGLPLRGRYFGSDSRQLLVVAEKRTDP